MWAHMNRYHIFVLEYYGSSLWIKTKSMIIYLLWITQMYHGLHSDTVVSTVAISVSQVISVESKPNPP